MKEAVTHMIEEEKNSAVRAAYERTLKNIEVVPINFFPKKNLFHSIYKWGKQVFTSEVLGEHRQEISVIRKGNKIIAVQGRRIIDIPAEHFFHENKLSWQGVHTLMHELCHDPMRNNLEFSKQVHLNHEQAEELTADLLSAKIGVKMGMSRERVLGFYHGREGVYGGFPFRESLERAIKPKEGKITPVKPREVPRIKKEMEKRKRITPLSRLPKRKAA